MLQNEKVCAVIVAGGSSRRMGFDKLLAPLEDGTVIQSSVRAFARHPLVDEIVVVAGEGNRSAIMQQVQSLPKVKAVVTGGAERSDSVCRGLEATDAPWAAIHDGARPFVSEAVITGALEGALLTGCAAPAVPVKDTVKVARDGMVVSTPERSTLYAVQTPQVVNCERYRRALQHLNGLAVTDDCMVMENDGCRVCLTEGDYANRKITTPEDLPAAKEKTMTQTQLPAIRVGHGYDVHRLVEGRRLIMGGCDIPFEKGLLGHSDADVLAHAVSDALLGAAALGDIGKHFPDTDPAYAGADSLQLLHHVCELLNRNGWKPLNVDATVLCQRPKLAPFILQMRENLAAAMQLEVDCVSVKATTEEKLGFTGAGDGIAAHCVALIAR